MYRCRFKLPCVGLWCQVGGFVVQVVRLVVELTR